MSKYCVAVYCVAVSCRMRKQTKIDKIIALILLSQRK